MSLSVCLGLESKSMISGLGQCPMEKRLHDFESYDNIWLRLFSFKTSQKPLID